MFVVKKGEVYLIEWCTSFAMFVSFLLRMTPYSNFYLTKSNDIHDGSFLWWKFVMYSTVFLQSSTLQVPFVFLFQNIAARHFYFLIIGTCLCLFIIGVTFFVYNFFCFFLLHVYVVLEGVLKGQLCSTKDVDERSEKRTSLLLVPVSTHCRVEFFGRC